MLNIILLLFYFTAFAKPSDPIQTLTCIEEVSNTLKKLPIALGWERVHHASDFTFLKSSIRGTRKANVWLSSTQEESFLLVQNGQSVVQHLFNKNQQCDNSNFTIIENMKKSYNALNFFEDSTKYPQFVIVLWSPHMAISIHQIQELKNKKFSVPVIFALDKNSNEKLAIKVLEKEKLTPDYLRKWDFVGHAAQGVEHYPSSFFVKNGKIVKYVPGYSDAQSFKGLIESLL